ncbi:uncharacterized protein naf1 [Paramisgurnus dabryanus]|uniref:uncharacterized protein naf1 n=1 Tax=Paramisgurnus dabryanus TaxID=90735 RepID=UPI0031F47551
MENTNTESITDGKIKDETQSEKMELDDNPHLQVELTDNLQSSSSQSVLTAESCTSGQSESNEGQCTNTKSEQTVQSIANKDQGIKIESEETGDCVASVLESGQTEDEHTSKTSGSAVMQCETVVSPVSGSGSLALLSMQYRGNSSDDNGSDSDSDSSSSTSSSSTSSSSSSSEPLALTSNLPEDDDEGVNMGNGKTPTPLKTQDELLIEDLPEVENLTISLPDDAELEAIGTISSIVEQLVIVESYKNTRALNEDSVLFGNNKNSIGKVFEVFGPVCQPYYVLRFNSKEDIDKKDLKIQDPVYFAPKIKDFTDYIFTERLKSTKGSDASWKNDQEPPPEALEFSDDEQERLAKHKLKEQKRRQQNDSDTDDESESHKAPPPQKPSRRKPRQNRNVPRGQHHNRGGGFHSNYHAHPHFPPPDYMFPHPDPHRFPFQGPMYPPYPRPPPPFHMGMPPWPPGANQGFMFQPPPPPPPPPSNQ